MNEIKALTMVEARAAMAQGSLEPKDLLDSVSHAIDDLNPALGAYSWLAEKGEVDFSLGHPLAGFSLALKANICAKGMRTDCGSLFLKNHFPAYDSTVVARLRKAGAHFPGTTAMDEFGMGSSCEHSPWGAVSNPWQTDYIAGGSSGGSAAAVAAGMAWYALGSDTGGSVRYPAHCCGLVGLKPTYGRLSRFGLIAFASSLDTVGVLARDIADVSLVFNTLAGHDSLDATSLTDAVEPPLTGRYSMDGKIVGVPWDLLETDIKPDVLADFKTTLKQLEADGVEIRNIDLPAIQDAVAIYTIVSSAEAASNLARFDGTAYGAREKGNTYAAMVTESRTRGLGMEVKRRILLGTHVLSAGYREQFYDRARAARLRVRHQFEEAFKTVQAIVTPTAKESAFLKGSRLADPLAMYSTDYFTIAANLAGIPALTIPTALGNEGMPLSIQFMGKPLSENNLFAMAHSVEKCRKFRTLREAPWNRPL